MYKRKKTFISHLVCLWIYISLLEVDFTDGMLNRRDVFSRKERALGVLGTGGLNRYKRIAKVNKKLNKKGSKNDDSSASDNPIEIARDKKIQHDEQIHLHHENMKHLGILQHYFPLRFEYSVRELHDLDKYPGAWYGLPSHFKFNYMPSEQEFEKRIVDNGDDILSLYSMVWYEVDHKNAKFIPDEQFFSLYWKYGQCKRKNDIYRSCPNPCHDPNICKIAGSTGRCRSFHDPKISTDINPKYKRYWEPLFQLNWECECTEGNRWKGSIHSCERETAKMIVRPTPERESDKCGNCENSGTCVHANGLYKCDCKPAWEGGKCTYPRNPCVIHPIPNCGDFQCIRDPANKFLGWRCLCDKVGYVIVSDAEPYCVKDALLVADEGSDDRIQEEVGVASTVTPPTTTTLQPHTRSYAKYKDDHLPLPRVTSQPPESRKLLLLRKQHHRRHLGSKNRLSRQTRMRSKINRPHSNSDTVSRSTHGRKRHIGRLQSLGRKKRQKKT